MIFAGVGKQPHLRNKGGKARGERNAIRREKTNNREHHKEVNSLVELFSGLWGASLPVIKSRYSEHNRNEGREDN